MSFMDVNTPGYAADKVIGEYPLGTMTTSKGMMTGLAIDDLGYHTPKNSFEGEPMTEALPAGPKIAMKKAMIGKGKM